MTVRTIGMALLIAFQFSGYAQKINFQHITSSDGLSQSEVYSFIEDSRGFMWFGTLDGLNRYDGYEIKIFNTEKNNPKSLSNNTIRSLTEDDHGRIWIGTDDGLSVYNPITEEINQVKISRFENDRIIIHSMLVDGDGLLLATSSGLLKANVNTSDLTRIEQNIKRVNYTEQYKKSVSQILKAPNGVIWLHSGSSMFGMVFQEGADQPIIVKRIQDNRFDDIRSMTVDHNNSLWFCSYHSGFFRYNPKNEKLDQFTEGSPNSSIVSSKASAITSDQNGNIWVGTRDKGLLFLNYDNTNSTNPVFNSVRSNPFDERSLNSNLIFSLYYSKSNLLWVGTIGSGINMYDPNQKEFYHYKIPPELDKYHPGSNFVRSIFSDYKNNIWIGTHSNGLYHYERKSGIYKKLGYGTQSVYFLLGIANKQVIVCTSNGVSIARLTEKDQILIQETPINHASFYAYKGENGDIWLATINGLYKCKVANDKLVVDSKWDSGTKPNLSFDNCRVLHYSKSRKELFVGTEGGGLNILSLNDGQEVLKISIYQKNESSGSLSNNYIRTIIEDQNKTIWLGTYEGLNKIKTTEGPKGITFESYTMKDGLPNNMVQLMVEDNDGYIWIGTNNGLCKFNAKTKEFNRYSITDGIQSNEFSEHAVFKKEDGEIIVGGINGFNSFYPENIQSSKTKPKTTITDFFLFNERISINSEKDHPSPLNKSIILTDSIFLLPKQKSLGFMFSALIHSNPEKVKYAYKLEGFDPDWNYTDSKNRLANYTNLEFGKYIFKVKATNSDGDWTDAITSIKIQIKKPFVYTWMAIVIYILTIILLIVYFTNYTVMKYTTKKKILLENEHNMQLHELDELRSRFFINISHDLRTPLTLIYSPLKIALQDINLSQETKNRLEIASRNVQKLRYTIEQLLDVTKAESGNLKFKPKSGELISFIKLEAVHFSDAIKSKGLELNILTDYDEITCQFDSDIISKIFFNLISNAIKYTIEGEINVRIDIISSHKLDNLKDSDYKQYIKIEIEDSGKGIPQDELNKIFDRFYQGDNKDVKGYGIGLSHCKDLISAHSGQIEAHSVPQNGTTFRIYLPKIDPIHSEDEKKSNTHIIPEIHIKSIYEENHLEPSQEGHLKKVLVIEDNTDMRSFIEHELSHEYRVITAENGLQGLEMAQKQNPDIIISDIMMPEMDGLKFCEKIKTDLKTSHIPVILLTAKGDEKTKYASIENGADDFIPKPFDIQYLSLRIKNLLDSKEKIKEKFLSGNDLEPSMVASTSLDKVFLTDLMTAIEEGLSDPEFTVNSLETKMGMSHTNFYRKLKTLTGQSGKEILMSMRMKRARQILKDSKGVRISEVAYSVGFSNPKYFSKCFKEYYGVLPSDINSI